MTKFAVHEGGWVEGAGYPGYIGSSEANYPSDGVDGGEAPAVGRPNYEVNITVTNGSVGSVDEPEHYPGAGSEIDYVDPNGYEGI